MKFNFSEIDPDETKVQDSFNTNVLDTLVSFAKKYEDLLPEGTANKIASETKSNDAFTQLTNIIQLAGLHIYVIIDEYDNFANTMLADSESNYIKLTHGDGFFRLFFNNLKAATTENDAAVSRIMISGVTPLTLSDVTSGYNIGMNISADSQFNSLAGFTETEFRQMLEYYRDATGVFNHTDNMVDSNISSDYNKMTKLIRFEQQFGEKTSLIQRINNDGYIYGIIKPEFALNDLERYENLVSLMFYMGLLSIGGYQGGRTKLIIPNSTVRQQYFQYMQRNYNTFMMWKTDDNIIIDLGYSLAWQGAHEPFFRYIADCMKDATKNNENKIAGI